MIASYVYWKREPQNERWKFIEGSELSDMIQRKGAMFATWTEFEAEPVQNEESDYEKLAVRRYGDLPLDFDAEGDIERARKCAVEVVNILAELGVPKKSLKIYVSGGKGFHIIIDRKMLGAEDGDPLLPLIYKDIVNDLFPVSDIRFKPVDRSLYCMGHGKMFRLPNVRRENGHYKIPISVEELETMDGDELFEMSESPRPAPEYEESGAVINLFRMFSAKQLFEHTMARTQKLPKRALKMAEKELLPCSRMLLSSTKKMSPKITFNELCFSAIVPSLREAGYSHDEIPLVPEVDTFLNDFEDSEGYRTPTERHSHFKNVVSRDRNTTASFSCGAMLKCLGGKDDVCRACKPRINAWLESMKDGANVDMSDPHDDNPNVEYLLQNFSWVHIGGKEAIYKNDGCGELEFLTKGAFDGMFANKPPVVVQDASGKIKTIPVTTVWRQHPLRKTYSGGVVFDPSGKDVDDKLNTWRGFPMEQPEMTLEEAEEGCKLFRQHVEHILCQDDPKSIKFMWAWLSDMVKRPGGKKPGSAIVLVGGKGIGKSIIARPFKKIMGYYCTTVASPDRLLSHFNSGISDKILLVLEEAVWGGSHEAESRLKSLITEQDMIVERKGFDAVEAKSFQRIIMCSNEDWVVPSSGDERRFFVLRMDCARPSPEYFDRLVFEIDNGGAEALYAWLLMQKLDDVRLFDPPVTKGLDEQKMVSADSVRAWWHDVLYTGHIDFDNKGTIFKEWDGEFDPMELYKAYTTWCNSNSVRAKPRRMVMTKLFGRGGIAIGRRSSKRIDGTVTNVYRVGSIETAREFFTRVMNLSDGFEWPEVETHEVEDFVFDV